MDASGAVAVGTPPRVAFARVDASITGRAAGALEPLHSMVYFAPEAEERYTAAGLEPGRMGYFASRSAPMGAVGAGPVAATFYNFSPSLVARHLPRAWTLVSPADLLAARADAADAALRRLLGDAVASDEVAEAAGLARTAAEAAPVDGRPLAAGLLDLDWPAAPHLVLWHAVSVLREYRGDGHIAVLGVEGLSGLEALVTFTATGLGFVPGFALKSRGWSAEQWSAAEAALRERGVLDASGALTAQGRSLRERVETATDRLGHPPYAALGADGVARLGDLGSRLGHAVQAAGAFPDGVFAPTSPRSVR